MDKSTGVSSGQTTFVGATMANGITYASVAAADGSFRILSHMAGPWTVEYQDPTTGARSVIATDQGFASPGIDPAQVVHVEDASRCPHPHTTKQEVVPNELEGLWSSVRHLHRRD